MITEFKTIPKAVYYVQTADGCTVLDPDGDTLAEITAPGGYFPGIGAADGGPGTVTFSAPVKRVIGPFDVAPQLLLTILGQLGGNGGLPAEFMRVEYLQSDGGQVINTELIPSNLTGYKAEVQLVSDAAGYACGVQNYSGAPGFWLRYLGSDFLMNFGAGGSCIITSNAAEIKLKHSIETNFLNSRLFVANGTKTNISNFDYKWGQPFTLFKARYASGYDLPVPMRIFSWQHSEGTELVLDLVPCVNTNTGEPCLYDLVNKKPLYNAGSGDFTSPTASTTFSLRRVLPDWGKLTENGLRRLYHAPANYTGELYDYALEHGYKPIVEPEKPETGYWFPRWTETEEEIVLEWVETEPPPEEYLTQPTE